MAKLTTFGVIGLLIFHLLTLEYFPNPFCDEAWNLARVLGYRAGGGWFGQLDRGVFDLMPGYQTFFPAIPVWLHSFFISLMPSHDFYAIRLSSWVCGVALVFVSALIAGRLFARNEEHLTSEQRVLDLNLHSICLMLLWPFFLSSHLGRFDILAALLTHLALLAALSITLSNAVLLGGVAAFLGVAALEVHPYSWCVVPAFAILVVNHLVNSPANLPLRFAIGFVLGILVGITWYAYLHFNPTLGAFLDFYQLAFFPTHLPSAQNSFVDTIQLVGRNLYYALPNLFSPMSSRFAQFFLAVVALLLMISRRRTDLVLVISYIVIILSFVFLTKEHGYYYFIHVAPATSWVVVRAIRRQMVRSRVVRLGFSACVMAGVLVTLYDRYNYLNTNDASTQLVQLRSDLRRVVTPDDIVIGQQVPWLALRQERYNSWESLIYYQRRYPGKSWRDALRFLKPTVIIIDTQMSLFLNDADHPAPAYGGKLSIPRGEFLEFLANETDKVDQFQSEILGEVGVYRIRGAAASGPPAASDSHKMT